MKKMLFQLFVVTLALTNGCTLVKPDIKKEQAIWASMESEISKEQAIGLAKQEAIRSGWKEVEVQGAELESGRWRVWLWRLPPMPGGHATVEISKDGKLIRFVGGK